MLYATNDCSRSTSGQVSSVALLWRDVTPPRSASTKAHGRHEQAQCLDRAQRIAGRVDADTPRPARMTYEGDRGRAW